MNCTTCGQPLQLRPYSHETRLFGRTILDEGHLVLMCPANHSNLTSEEALRFRRRALAALLREGIPPGMRILDGEAFLATLAHESRVAMGLSQESLGTLLDCRGESVSRWEKGRRPIPRATQLALAGLLLSADGADFSKLIGRARARSLLRRVPSGNEIIRIGQAA